MEGRRLRDSPPSLSVAFDGALLRAGALVGATAMAGDCMASFLKRRLGLAISSMALGLDQVPESLLPAISMRAYAELSALDIMMVVLIFFVVELAVFRVFFRLGLRERPY
jgi:CDP-2,3-bis-(O-geranylgeranyl)-sn-glycerol synthase